MAVLLLLLSRGDTSYMDGWPAAIPPFDKRDPSFVADPYPTYAYLRTRHPVFYVSHLDAWLVTRAVDLQAALKNADLGHRDQTIDAARMDASGPPSGPSAIAALQQQSVALTQAWIVMRNPPAHTRLLAVLEPYFHSRRLDDALMAAQRSVQASIGQLPHRQSIDLMAAVLTPAARAAADEFLDIPGTDGIRLSQLAHRADAPVDFDPDPLTSAAGAMAQVGMADYLRAHLRHAVLRSDAGIVAGLRAAVADGAMSEFDAVANLQLMATAAYVNISRHLANMLHALLKQRTQWQMLAAAPTLARVAAEEATRYASTTQCILRRARADTRIGDHEVAKGACVMLCVAAANRDPALHVDPDRLDLGRRPVRHWTFGEGLHFCVGAALSRRVSAAVLQQLATAVPDLTLAAPVEFKASYIKRIPTALIAAIEEPISVSRSAESGAIT